MANVKISDLTAATVLALADLLEVEQGAVSKKGTLELVRAALNVPIAYTLTADETRNNTTTLTASALSASMEAGFEYAFEVEGVYSSPTATPDVKYDLTVPAGASGYHDQQARQLTAGAQASDITAALIWGTYAGSSIRGLAYSRGRVYNPTNAGDLTFRWAQNTATAEATTLHKGFQMRVVKVGAV